MGGGGDSSRYQAYWKSSGFILRQVLPGKVPDLFFAKFLHGKVPDLFFVEFCLEKFRICSLSSFARKDSGNVFFNKLSTDVTRKEMTTGQTSGIRIVFRFLTEDVSCLCIISVEEGTKFKNSVVDKFP